MDAQNVKIVATDLFRRHFLVYDESFKKIGTVDVRLGVWTFTHAQTSESWFGYSRDDAINSWLRSLDDSSFVKNSPSEGFLGLKSTLQERIAEFQTMP